MINPSRRGPLGAIALVVGVILASCSASPSSSAGSSTGGGGNAGGKASSIDACKLLTTDEIKQATGARMGAGVLQTTDTQADCEWNAPDGASGANSVGVIVQDYDDTLWKTMASSQHATAVSALGEQAFKGFPHSGDLSVKKGSYEIDVGIIDFSDDNATVDAASLTLMKLVLSRV